MTSSIKKPTKKILDLKKGWRFHILDFEFGYSEFNTLPDTFYFENYIPVLRMQCSIYPVWSLDRISQMLIWISMELFDCNEKLPLNVPNSIGSFQHLCKLSNFNGQSRISSQLRLEFSNFILNFPTTLFDYNNFSTGPSLPEIKQ